MYIAVYACVCILNLICIDAVVNGSHGFAVKHGKYEQRGEQVLCGEAHQPVFTCRCVRCAALYPHGGAWTNPISYLKRMSKNISQVSGN